MAIVCRGYVRVSTEEQALEGYSLEAQTQTLRRAAKEQGWTLAEVYADEGISARQLNKREGIKRLLAELRPGEVVLFWRLDRLNRNLRNSEWFFDEVEAKRSTFYSITEPMLSTAGPQGKFVRQIMGAVAELYSGILGENVRNGMAQMAREGKWTGGPTPFGYDHADGKLSPNAQSALVRSIFDMYLKGNGVRSIAATLNHAGHRTRHGAEWSSATVSYILRQPLYAGLISFGRKISGKKQTGDRVILAEGEQEAIIDREIWLQAQTVLERRKKIPARQATGDYPLTGIASCGLCGAAISGARYDDKTHKTPRRMYRCCRRQHRKTCTLIIMSAEKLEAAFLRTVESLTDAIIQDAFVAQQPVVDRGASLDDMEKQIADVDRKLQRWDAAFETGALDLDAYRQKVKPLRDQRKGLVTAVESARRSGADLRADALCILVKTFPAAWQAATWSERKELAHTLCEQVIISPDYQVQLILRS